MCAVSAKIKPAKAFKPKVAKPAQTTPPKPAYVPPPAPVANTGPAAGQAGSTRPHVWFDWLDNDGHRICHYCSVCKTVRHPNGKLDKDLCPGPRKPTFSAKPKARPKAKIKVKPRGASPTKVGQPANKEAEHV